MRPEPLPRGQGLRWTSSPLLRAGVGRLRLPGPGQEDVFFAVDMPNSERRLERAGRAVLRRVARGGRLRVVSFDAAQPEGAEERAARLWPLLAALTALALVGESVLAYVFSNPRGAAEWEGGRP